jgi:hypothetical protein
MVDPSSAVCATPNLRSACFSPTSEFNTINEVSKPAPTRIAVIEAILTVGSVMFMASEVFGRIHETIFVENRFTAAT